MPKEKIAIVTKAWGMLAFSPIPLKLAIGRKEKPLIGRVESTPHAQEIWLSAHPHRHSSNTRQAMWAWFLVGTSRSAVRGKPQSNKLIQSINFHWP